MGCLARPRVEALEDRCLLSAPIPNPSALAGLALIAAGNEVVASLPKGDPRIVFLGDSITWSFAYDLGASVWYSLLAPLGAANYGAIGQNTTTLAWQLTALHQLAGIHPSVIVVNIGTNNLLFGDSPQQTAAGTVSDVNLIHSLQPQAEVLVVGVLPSYPSPGSPYRLAVSQTNALVNQMLAGDPKTMFVDIGPSLLLPGGALSSTVTVDFIHPTALGYLLITEALEGPLTRALSAQS